jgi:hypothetical protein
MTKIFPNNSPADGKSGPMVDSINFIWKIEIWEEINKKMQIIKGSCKIFAIFYFGYMYESGLPD